MNLAGRNTPQEVHFSAPNFFARPARPPRVAAGRPISHFAIRQGPLPPP